MSTVIGDSYPYPLESAKRRRIEIEVAVPIGATGAVGTLISDDPGITVTRTGVGVYAFTFPAGADTGGSIDATLVQATPTAKAQFVTAFSPTAGTATIKYFAADTTTATDPANGDTIRVQIFLNSRREF